MSIDRVTKIPIDANVIRFEKLTLLTEKKTTAKRMNKIHNTGSIKNKMGGRIVSGIDIPRCIKKMVAPPKKEAKTWKICGGH
jgi:hypothetical protein